MQNLVRRNEAAHSVVVHSYHPLCGIFPLFLPSSPTEQTLPKDEGDANTVKLFWLARFRGHKGKMKMVGA